MEKYCAFFTLGPSDLLTTFTYVLMDNFCSCFFVFHKNLLDFQENNFCNAI